MEVISNSYMPGDPRLVQQLVNELKSQGIFDQFRKECFADVDTKPAYQNLRQRVEGSVAAFLKEQKWSPDMNKNQVREQLKKNIYESNYLETGVERIVDQVVNPKINTVFLPIVEDVVYKYLGIEKRQDLTNKPDTKATDLLPKDLEAVSPDSVHSSKPEQKDKIELLNDSVNSKMDEDESPPFEPLEGTQQAVTVQEENSLDSELSGMSGLQSHESNLASESKSSQMDWSWQDTQQSQNSSESKISAVASEDQKSDSNKHFAFLKNVDSDSITSSNTKIDDDTVKTENSVESMVIEEEEFTLDSQKQNKGKEEASLDVEQKTKTNKEDDVKKHRERKSSETKRDDKKRSDDKKSKSSSKHSSKDDKHRKSSSSRDKDKDKSSSRHSSSSKDRNTKDGAKDKDKSKDDAKDKDKNKDDAKDKDKNKDDAKNSKDDAKNSKDKDSKISKDGHEKDKAKEKDKHSKSKDKEDDKSSKQRHDKDKDKSKSKKESDKTDIDKHKTDKDKEKSSKDKSEKEKERSRDRGDKSKSDKSKDKKKSDEKSEKNEKRDKDKNRSSSNSNDKTVAKDSSSSTNSKKEASKDSKSSDKHKKDKYSRDDSKDKKRDSKKDDHYSSKEKKNHRRSFDRDSNDGQSSKNSVNSVTKISESQQTTTKETSSTSVSGSGDSGNSDANEIRNDKTEAPVQQITIQANIEIPKVKYIKPKFALNFAEAKRLMKIRKQLAILERQNQLSLADLNIVQNGVVEEKRKDDNETKKEVDKEEDLTPTTSPPFRGFTKDSEEPPSTCKIEEPKPKLSAADLNLQSIFLSKENWEALEARLEEEMLKLNFSAYESHYDDYDDDDCSSIVVSPGGNNSAENSCVIEEIVPSKSSKNDKQKTEELINESVQDTEEVIEETIDEAVVEVYHESVDGFVEETIEFDGQVEEIVGNDVEVIEEVVEAYEVGEMKSMSELDDRNHVKQDKINNHTYGTRNLSVRLKDINLQNNYTFAAVGDNLILDDEGVYFNSGHFYCTHFKKPYDVVKKLHVLNRIINKLEEDLEYSIKKYQNNVFPEESTKVVKRGRKRKFDENVDIKNNNNKLNYAKISGIKKRGRPPSAKTLNKAGTEKVCNPTDIVANENFSMPLSPAESDKSFEKKEEYFVTPLKQRSISRSTAPRVQRYTSDDLYKPRPIVSGTRRSKKDKTP